MTAYEPPGRPGAGTGPAQRADPAADPAAYDAVHDVAYDAVVLAGGAARRLGGADKPGVRVGGRALLDRVLAACGGARTTVVVAAPRPTARPVTWAREDPPGGGPLAALGAGLGPVTAEHVVVLSADLPFLQERTVGRLLDTLRASGADGVLLTDPDGRDQPLVAAYRTRRLHETLELLAGRHGGLDGLPLRRLVAELDLTRVLDPVASFDCDTWDDIATARARIREHGHVLDEWISAVKDELGIDLDVDTRALLDLARDAAHGVARPAAPLTTFLVGYAAARAGSGPEAVAEASRKAAALAARWAEENTSKTQPAGSAQPDASVQSPASAQADVAPDATPDTRPDAG
ncbi:NTP transferase domain-containing protein [Streptomyces sp. Go-475]|uniref:NTP transferase domain-containing protein n=1 Tax=Streptomyces sp. Go-475 TaxID=2072505 RepID=UPI000DEFE277|nr:NTP transferase domain-containing protein [Streptomyces sp. Go-475]AXE87253.1 molybdopterin-guanine dinucleotide biosynthesis protein MobA [Streptomyces sp. Go-475]